MFEKSEIKFASLKNVRIFAVLFREHSSVGLEHLPYKQRVGGSTPSAPTKSLGNFSKAFFVCTPVSFLQTVWFPGACWREGLEGCLGAMLGRAYSTNRGVCLYWVLFVYLHDLYLNGSVSCWRGGFLRHVCCWNWNGSAHGTAFGEACGKVCRRGPLARFMVCLWGRLTGHD